MRTLWKRLGGDSQRWRRLGARVLHIASFVMALSGIILLVFCWIHREVPRVKISDLSPEMYFEPVRVTGKITRGAIVLKSGDVRFHLKDGSGDLSVRGDPAQAKALRNSNQLPQRGDVVEVTGSQIPMEGENDLFRMQSVRRLELNFSTPSAFLGPLTRLSDLTPDQKGERVSVRGTLKEISIPGPSSRAPYVLTLADGETELPVIFWDSVFQRLGRKLPTPGTRIKVCARVEIYRGALQLKLLDAENLCETSDYGHKNHKKD